MRKDVKFGLTIGGVLVLVLAVYIAVVVRAPESHIKPGDVSFVPANPVAPDAEPAAPAVVTGNPGSPVTPSPVVTSVPDAAVPIKTPEAVSAAPTPTTEPSVASASGHVNDWESALKHGSLFNQSEPERTVTPAATDDLPMAAPSMTDPASDRTLASSTPTTMPSIAARTHRVQPGETFASISAAVYGSSHYFNRLIAANPSVDPHRLKPGMIINIPAASDVVAAAPAESAAASVTPADPGHTYTVQAGDTLARICRKLYGTEQWDKIYELNKDVIGADPAKLKLHMVLKLPDQSTVSAAH